LTAVLSWREEEKSEAVTRGNKMVDRSGQLKLLGSSNYLSTVSPGDIHGQRKYETRRLRIPPGAGATGEFH